MVGLKILGGFLTLLLVACRLVLRVIFPGLGPFSNHNSATSMT